jgi:hypothetical protein
MLTFRDVRSQIGDQGARAHLLFETFIRELLKEHLARQQKTLLGEPGQLRIGAERFVADAIAPNGIDELGGPTLIEIKYQAGPPGTGFFSRALAQLQLLSELGEFKSVLLVIGDRLPSPVREQLTTRVRAWNRPLPFEVWDSGQLEVLVEQYQDLVSTLLPRLEQRRLAIALASPSTDAEESQTRLDLVSHARNAYANGELSLFLGAGVSVEAGVPTWKALINALLVRMIDGTAALHPRPTPAEVDDLALRLGVIEGGSPLLTARYLRRGMEEMLGGPEAFIQEVTTTLYSKVRSGDPRSVPILNSIAELSRPQRTGTKVRTVVTYNFDDLLERAFGAAGVRHRSIFREGDLAGPEDLPVQHVHGFLPRDRNTYVGLEQSTWAFSEEGYHALFADPYHWSNLVQLNALRENTCILIGLSLGDPNLRRLLEIASRRNGTGRHVVVLRRISRTDLENARCATCELQVLPSDTRPEVFNSFLTRHESLHEALAAELGARVLWVSQYAEIPGLIDDIRRP